MGISVKGLEEVQGLLTSLGRFVNAGSREAVDKGSKDIAKDLREAIGDGLDASHSRMAPLKKATL